jgi:hypothetical protein
VACTATTVFLAVQTRAGLGTADAALTATAAFLAVQSSSSVGATTAARAAPTSPGRVAAIARQATRRLRRGMPALYLSGKEACMTAAKKKAPKKATAKKATAKKTAKARGKKRIKGSICPVYPFC